MTHDEFIKTADKAKKTLDRCDCRSLTAAWNCLILSANSSFVMFAFHSFNSCT